MLSKDYEGVNRLIHPMKLHKDAIEAAQPIHSHHSWWLKNAVVAPLPRESIKIVWQVHAASCGLLWYVLRHIRECSTYCVLVDTYLPSQILRWSKRKVEKSQGNLRSDLVTQPSAGSETPVEPVSSVWASVSQPSISLKTHFTKPKTLSSDFGLRGPNASKCLNLNGLVQVAHKTNAISFISVPKIKLSSAYKFTNKAQ